MCMYVSPSLLHESWFANHIIYLMLTGHYGGSATLLCSIDSLIPFTVRWYREGAPISPQQYFRYEYNTLHKFFRSRYSYCKIFMYGAGEVYSSFSCLVLKRWQAVKKLLVWNEPSYEIIFDPASLFNPPRHANKLHPAWLIDAWWLSSPLYDTLSEQPCLPIIMTWCYVHVMQCFMWVTFWILSQWKNTGYWQSIAAPKQCVMKYS